jgi:hypothetical protein
MADRQTLQIRSFRVVFDLERRLHKVDRWRIPLPYGVPVRGLVYGIAALAAVMTLTRLPLAGALVGLLPPSVRYAVLPCGVAVALTRLRIDGRPAHRALCALARHLAGPGRLVAFRPAPADAVVVLGDVTLAADERASRYRPAEIRGPVVLRLRYPVRGRQRRSTLVLEPAGESPLRRGKRLDVAAGQKVVIR